MISGDGPRRFQAGDAMEDLCRVCKTVRGHTVIVADSTGGILRVICEYCGSQHDFGSGDIKESAAKISTEPARRAPIPLVTERERISPAVNIPMPEGIIMDLELLLRRIIREETGLTPVPMADKWHGGEMILKPGKPDLQGKSRPVETFFHKVVMLRNRLRVLEQQINGAEIPEDLKVKLQGYITACYGTLTSFNILFAEEEDRFRGNSERE
jgi:hypothetical protein